MPATALCLSEQSDWRGLEGALYCPGGSVRDAQYAAGRDRFDRLAAGIGGACREAHRTANRQPDLNASVGALKNPHNDITLVGEAPARDGPALSVGRRPITSPWPQTSVASARP